MSNVENHFLVEVELLKYQNKVLQDQISNLQAQVVALTKQFSISQDQISELRTEFNGKQSNQSNQEIYYQRLLEQKLPGAGHMTLKTAAGSRFVTDLTTPDDWNPAEHDGMPSCHIEIKSVTGGGYKEIPVQLTKAQTALPRQLLLAILFVNPSVQKLKDIWALLHPQGMKLAYFDHQDQLWWFDGQKQRPFTDMWNISKEPFSLFVHECVSFGDPRSSEFRTKNTDVYDALDAWCRKNNMPPVKFVSNKGDTIYRQDLKKILHVAFGDRAKEVRRIVDKYGKSTVRVFEGMKLR